MQLTKPSEVRKESVIFCESKTDKHGNESIKIQTKYPDNKTGPLVIETPFLFSFGVNERKSLDSDELVGYTLPVCLWGKDEDPTPEQTEFFSCLTKIQVFAHKYLEKTHGADVSERLRDLLYYKVTTDKKGREKKDQSVPPVLYVKLIYSGKRESIVSLFRTKVDKVVDSVDPMIYFEKYCTVKLALIIDSIYISETSAAIQVKVGECYVKPQKAFAFEPLLTIDDSDEEVENYDTIR